MTHLTQFVCRSGKLKYRKTLTHHSVRQYLFQLPLIWKHARTMAGRRSSTAILPSQPNYPYRLIKQAVNWKLSSINAKSSQLCSPFSNGMEYRAQLQCLSHQVNMSYHFTTHKHWTSEYFGFSSKPICSINPIRKYTQIRQTLIETSNWFTSNK